MRCEVTFTKADGSRVMRYMVMADDAVTLSSIMTRLVTDVVAIIGPRPHVDIYTLKSC